MEDAQNGFVVEVMRRADIGRGCGCDLFYGCGHRAAPVLSRPVVFDRVCLPMVITTQVIAREDFESDHKTSSGRSSSRDKGGVERKTSKPIRI